MRNLILSLLLVGSGAFMVVAVNRLFPTQARMRARWIDASSDREIRAMGYSPLLVSVALSIMAGVIS